MGERDEARSARESASGTSPSNFSNSWGPSPEDRERAQGAPMEEGPEYSQDGISVRRAAAGLDDVPAKGRAGKTPRMEEGGSPAVRSAPRGLDRVAAGRAKGEITLHRRE